MSHLIDGYNLLYALGRLTPRSGRPGLEAARRWLLARLRAGHGPDADITVVFDARITLPGAAQRQDFGNILFVFAQGQSADDHIEEVITASANPRQITVISDDHQIQKAARRRGCPVVACLDYYETYLQPGRPPAPAATSAEPPTKPEPSTPEEVQQWLEVFDDPTNDDPLLHDPF
jgi:predicted RNA-binding protein with PIN domain